VKEQVLESPFCKKEFLELVDIVSEVKTTKLANFAISDSSIVNIGDRDFVDYRPDISIDPQVLKDNNISTINFDSLHFFQVQNLVEEIDTKSVKIKKSDVAVNLILPKTYEEYLESLTKKNRHHYILLILQKWQNTKWPLVTLIIRSRSPKFDTI